MMNEKQRPKVINLKGKRDTLGPSLEHAEDVIYVGRRMTQGGWKLKDSVFANPFKTKDHGEKVIAIYRDHLMREIGKDPERLIPMLMDMQGKTLGCWCTPSFCHANVIADVVVEIWRSADSETAMDEFVAKLPSL
jgi:hypothetical protein